MILHRQEIIPTEAQKPLLISGWGKDVIENSVVEKIIYQSDEYKVAGYIAYPLQQTEEKYPCIIWNRGGAKDRGHIDEFTAKGLYGKLASWGYVVIASMYRGSIKGEGVEEFGGKDVNDILNLIPLADELPFADTNIWGIEGWSRGGMMTYLTLRKDNRFRCAILTGAISDLTGVSGGLNQSQELFEKIIPAEDLHAELRKRSAIHFVDELPRNTKYLIIHGGDDKVVSPIQSIKMAESMRQKNFDVDFHLLEGDDHFVRKNRKPVEQMRKNFFDLHLKNKK